MVCWHSGNLVCNIDLLFIYATQFMPGFAFRPMIYHKNYKRNRVVLYSFCARNFSSRVFLRFQVILDLPLYPGDRAGASVDETGVHHGHTCACVENL